MKQEIKERIEQINNGIIPEGYKKTKIGIMPIDWDIADLGLLISESKELSNDINKYKVFSSSRNGLIPQNDYYNRESVETNNGYKIVPNGFVTYRHMSDDDVFHFNVNTTGASVLVSSEYPVFCSTENSCLGFLVPCLNHSARFRYYCKLQKKGGTRTRLYYNILCKYTIAHPKIEEQEKIAEILSAQDKVIELKEKLIEQKYLQKKYVIQKLILNESSTNEMIKLGCWINEIDVRSTCNNMYPVLTSSRKGICLQEEYFNKSVSSFDNTGYKVLSKNDFVYRTISDDGVFVFNKLDLIEKGLISPAYYSFRCNNNCDSDYLYYLLNSGYLKKDISILMQGGTRLSLNFGKLCSVLIPNVSLGKQKRISEIIKTLDKEIKLLEQELEQEKQKKKALMQLLLTGIVRV